MRQKCKTTRCATLVQVKSGPGRKQEYCEACLREKARRRQELKRARDQFGKLLACGCYRSGWRKCPQHKQFAEFLYDARRWHGARLTAADGAALPDYFPGVAYRQAKGFRIARDPDSYLADTSRQRREDKKVDALIKRDRLGRDISEGDSARNPSEEAADGAA